jgi:hypothetical protein
LSQTRYRIVEMIISDGKTRMGGTAVALTLVLIDWHDQPNLSLYLHFAMPGVLRRWHPASSAYEGKDVSGIVSLNSCALFFFFFYVGDLACIHVSHKW